MHDLIEISHLSSSTSHICQGKGQEGSDWEQVINELLFNRNSNNPNCADWCDEEVEEIEEAVAIAAAVSSFSKHAELEARVSGLAASLRSELRFKQAELSSVAIGQSHGEAEMISNTSAEMNEAKAQSEAQLSEYS